MFTVSRFIRIQNGVFLVHTVYAEVNSLDLGLNIFTIIFWNNLIPLKHFEYFKIGMSYW